MSVEQVSLSKKQFSKKTGSPKKKKIIEKSIDANENKNKGNKKRPFATDGDEASSPKKFKGQFSKAKNAQSNGTASSGDQKAKPGKKKRPHPSGEGDEASPSKKNKTGKFNMKRDFKSKKGFPSKKQPSGPTEKPDWKKLKADKRDLRVKRRTAACGSDMYTLSIQAKKMMEPLRNRKCSTEQQKEQIPKVYGILKGKMLAVVYSHDMARVIAMMLKWAHTLNLSDITAKVAKELLPEVVKMSECMYPAHVVRSLIDYCQPQVRAEMVTAFQGHVVRLLGHKFASGVLERLYKNLKCEQQYELCKELYGSTHKLVPSKTITGLKVIFECWPSMKESTLNNTQRNLLRIFEKGLVHSRMVHYVLVDYLDHANPDDCTAIFEQIRVHIKALTGTKEGVTAIMKCLWASASKDRKKAVRELKEDVVDLACKEHSYQLLLTVFDIFDDTLFVHKAILDKLLQDDNLAVLLNNCYGRKVFVYLCNRRDPKMFTEAGIAKIVQGDSNPNSKKDLEIRVSELQKVAVPRLLKHFVENSSLWMEENRNILVLLSALQAGSGEELKAALEAIAKYVANPPNSQQEGIDIRIADNAGCHMVLKKLAEHDKASNENGQATFGAALISELTDDHYSAWLKNNRCCFLLLNILKNGSKDVTAKLRSKIKSLSTKVWNKKNPAPPGGQEILQIL